ncbi:MAG: enoyl-CoA hydratase-related protein [Anaerolineales bacterium]|jgi:2-(1,2-epoxy-1,2-dihydrophenyl)acetyl-CoA isomerase
MSFGETLIVQEENGVLELYLNRPKANAFNFEMVDALLEACAYARKESGVRCVLLSGSGSFFSSGQDLKVVEEIGLPVPFQHHLGRTYNRIVLSFVNLEKPVLGAINGATAGAGLGIALATDVRWAAESASFHFGFSGIGLTADSGVSLTLPLHIGMARASEMAFSNRAVSAQEALTWGLVSRVLADDELLDEMRAFAVKIAQGPTRAFGLTKRAFKHAVLHALPEVLKYEASLQEIAGRTEDHAEGLRAFLEKRSPEYQGL